MELEDEYISGSLTRPFAQVALAATAMTGRSGLAFYV